MVDEIARIHSTKVNSSTVDDEKRKEILDLVEGGNVQAWAGDPNSQGGFVLYRPYDSELLRSLVKPLPDNNPTLYFAGEGISFTHGWIQGALESGLFASHLLNKSIH